MKTDKISVVVPVYKVEPYLRQCLDSVINQTYRNLEIFLVDDGSPDNCGAICDEYAGKDGRICVIHKENEGLSAARNEGIARATGEWITFVDSDDWCELDYYEQMMRCMGEETPDLFWAGGHFRESGKHSQKHIDIHNVFFSTRPEERPALIARKIESGAPWDVLYRRSFLESEGLCFDTRDVANEDVWFNFLAHIHAKEIGGCPFAGYHYREAPGSITRGYNPKKPEICYRLIRKCNEYVEQHGLDPQIAHALDIRALKQITVTFRCSWFHPANRQSPKEMAREIREMKTWPYYARAISSRNDSGMSLKRRTLKHMLRLPWIWPLKLLFTANERLKGRA